MGEQHATELGGQENHPLGGRGFRWRVRLVILLRFIGLDAVSLSLSSIFLLPWSCFDFLADSLSSAVIVGL